MVFNYFPLLWPREEKVQLPHSTSLGSPCFKIQICFRLRGSGASVTQEATRNYLRSSPFHTIKVPNLPSACNISFFSPLCYSESPFILCVLCPFHFFLFFFCLFGEDVRCLKTGFMRGICRNCFNLSTMTRSWRRSCQKQVEPIRDNALCPHVSSCSST